MEKPEKYPSFLTAFIVIIGIVFLSQVFSNDFRIKILNIFRGPLKLVSGLSYVLRDVAGFKNSRDENRILRENIDNLEKQVLDLKEFDLENKRLRELLGFRDSSKDRKFVPAMVIARDPSGLIESVIIDKGKGDAVRKDMAVVSGNALVGRVRESGHSIARVLLITDVDSVVSAIAQRTRDEGAVTGNGRDSLIMKYVELTSDIKEGDEVVTSGFGGIFEKGILIGKVLSVRKDANGLYLNAIIKPEVNIDHLEAALVMR